MDLIKHVQSSYYFLNFLKYSVIGKLKKNCISSSSRIRGKVFLSHVSLGKYNYLGPNSILNDVVIQNYCSIAPHVQIGGMEHDYQKLSTSTRLFNHRNNAVVVIEDDVWIGAAALIRRGVCIGRGAIIGAGALVLKDVEPYTIVVGSPARKLKDRFDSPTINELEQSQWWKYPPKKAKRILAKINRNN